MTYIPDPIELGEMRMSRCEDRIHSDGTYKCSCGNIVALDECQALSADPYAEPYCGDCCEKYYKEQEAKSKV